jgi:hypothetical protein
MGPSPETVPGLGESHLGRSEVIFLANFDQSLTIVVGYIIAAVWANNPRIREMTIYSYSGIKITEDEMDIVPLHTVHVHMIR